MRYAPVLRVWAVNRSLQLVSLLPASLTAALAKINAKDVRMHDAMRVKEYTSPASDER